VPARRRHAREAADVPSLPADAREAASPQADVAWDEAPPEGDSPAAMAVPTRAHEPPQSDGPPLVPARAAEAAQPRTARRIQQVRPEPEPEPVRVTIGRVEVVAQSPPPPVPAPAATAAPRLSLDEYLRTRGGLER
jgi:hypothetical protein